MKVTPLGMVMAVWDPQAEQLLQGKYGDRAAEGETLDFDEGFLFDGRLLGCFDFFVFRLGEIVGFFDGLLFLPWVHTTLSDIFPFKLVRKKQLGGRRGRQSL